MITSHSKIMLAALALLFATDAFSQSRHPIQDRKFWVDAGLFYPEQSVTLTIDSDILGENLPIDLEGDLDLSERSGLFDGEIGWRFSQNWSVSLQYFETERNASRTLEEEIEWEDVVYEIGIDVRAGTGASVTRLAFDWLAINNDRHQVKLALGAHILSVDAFIEGQARLDDDSTEFRREEADTTAPLPNIGLGYVYSPNDRWALYINADWFGADIDIYSGELIDTFAGLNFRITDHFGVGLEYRYLSLDGSIDEDDWSGRLESSYQGPAIYLSGYW